jgi:hypothetical protein
MSSDKRQFPRRTLGFVGWINISNLGVESLVECTIDEASMGGARLTLRSVLNIPESFELRLTKTAQTAKQCRVVWREHNVVGVEFLGESRIPMHL